MDAFEPGSKKKKDWKLHDGNMHGAETLLASQGMRGFMYSVMYDAQKHCSPHHEPPFMTSSMG